MKISHVDKPQFMILLFLVSFASVGAVLFTPALPSITSFFQVSVGQAQLTITSYLIGYALGQLPYGPLANRFGRKKTLIHRHLFSNCWIFAMCDVITLDVI